MVASAWNALLPMRLKTSLQSFLQEAQSPERNTSLVLSGPWSTWFDGELAKPPGAGPGRGLQQATLESEAVEPCLAQSRGVFFSFIMVMSFFFFNWSIADLLRMLC